MFDWSQAIAGLGAAIGSAVGQQIGNVRARKIIDNVWAEKETAMLAEMSALKARITALEAAQGWTPRKADQP